MEVRKSQDMEEFGERGQIYGNQRRKGLHDRGHRGAAGR